MSGWLHLTLWTAVIGPVGLLIRVLPHPVIPIALGLIPIGILVVLHLPQVMVLGFVIFSFFRIHEAFPFLFALKIPLLLSLASIFALGWHIFVSRKIQVFWRPELTYWFVFIGLVTIGVPLASNAPIAIAYFTSIFWKIALMLLAIVWLNRSGPHFAMAGALIVAAGVAVSAVALFNKAQGIGLVEGTRVTIGRSIGSVLGDPNDLALVLMFPAAFTLAYVVDKRCGWSMRTLALLAFFALFAAIIATQSRGGLLGILAVVGFYWLRVVKSIWVSAVAGSLGIILLYAVAGISDRQSGGAAEEGIDASAMGRIYAWEAAIGMAVDNPLTGVGLDNFYVNYFFYSPHWDGLNHAVHSTWFGVLAETGFLGLFAFILAIFVTQRSGIRMLKQLDGSACPDASIHRASQSVVAGIWGTIVSGTFLTQGFTWPIYILAALQIALLNYHEKQKH